jgi:hypothetical protein
MLNMTSLRSTKHRDALNTHLSNAFSRTVSKEHNEKAFGEWNLQLLSKLQSTAYFPARFEQKVFTDFAKDFKTSQKLSSRKTEMFKLATQLYQMAMSLDYVEQLEEDNSKHGGNEYQRLMQEASQARPDLKTFEKEQIEFKELCQSDIKADIAQLAYKHLEAQYNQHDEEAKKFDDLVDKLERKLQSATDIAPIEAEKKKLLDDIKAKKKALPKAEDLKFDKKVDNAPTILPPFATCPAFKRIKSEFDRLTQEIKRIDQHYENQKEPLDRKTAIPEIQPEELKAIRNIQNGFVPPKDQKALIQTEMVATINGQHWKKRPQWDALRECAITLHHSVYFGNSMGNIVARAGKILQTRAELIAAQKEKIEKKDVSADAAQVNFNSEAKEVRQVFSAFCSVANQELQRQYAVQCKEYAVVRDQKKYVYKRIEQRLNTLKIAETVDRNNQRIQREQARKLQETYDTHVVVAAPDSKSLSTATITKMLVNIPDLMRKNGINPEKAKEVAKETYEIVLTDRRILRFSGAGIRLFSPDRKQHLDLVGLQDKAKTFIPPEYRLKA